MSQNLVNQVSPSGRFKSHPLSASFSTMSDIELATLARSIQRAGQIDDIIMVDDQVLDGWNRVLACEMAGVEPRVRGLREGECAIDSVIGRNFDRRTPTDSAKAVAMVEMYFKLNKLDEAGPANDLSGGGNFAPLGETDWTTATIWPQSRKQLAELAGVSQTLIKQALRLHRKAVPAIVEAVRSGTVPLGEAMQLLWQKRHHQAACLDELIEQREKAKLQRRAEQKEAAALKKTGLLRGDKSMSTAQRLQASRAQPGENSGEEVQARVNARATGEGYQDFYDAIRSLGLCIDLLTKSPDSGGDHGETEMLANACKAFLELIEHSG